MNGLKSLRFGHFMVQQRKEDYNIVYFIDNGELLTHTKTWKRATKIASLLEFAYSCGYKDCEDDHEEDYCYLEED